MVIRSQERDFDSLRMIVLANTMVMFETANYGLMMFECQLLCLGDVVLIDAKCIEPSRKATWMIYWLRSISTF
jgi:hypothetical protein